MFHKKSYHYCQQKVSPSNNKNGLVANHSFSAYTLLQRVIIGLLQQRVKIARRAPTTLFYYILHSMVNYGYQKGPSICVFFCLSLSLCLPVLSQHFFTCYLLLFIINSIGLLRSLNYGWSKINNINCTLFYNCICSFNIDVLHVQTAGLAFLFSCQQFTYIFHLFVWEEESFLSLKALPSLVFDTRHISFS